MTRNMELIKLILLSVEAGNGGNVDGDYDKDTVIYHQDLLIRAGFLEGTIHNTLRNRNKEIPTKVFIKRLTWEGHEFLDAIKQKPIWEAIKAELKDASLGTIFRVAKQLLEELVKRKFEALLDSVVTRYQPKERYI